MDCLKEIQDRKFSLKKPSNPFINWLLNKSRTKPLFFVANVLHSSSTRNNQFCYNTTPRTIQPRTGMDFASQNYSLAWFFAHWHKCRQPKRRQYALDYGCLCVLSLLPKKFICAQNFCWLNSVKCGFCLISFCIIRG